MNMNMKMTKPKTKEKIQSLEILKEARNIISNPENWTKEMMAGVRKEYKLTKDGERKVPFSSVMPVDINFPDANCFCLLGAIKKAGINLKQSVHKTAAAVMCVAKTVDERAGTSSLVKFNDSKTTPHKDVIEVLDITIKNLET